MKQVLRWLCIALALCMLIGVLAACGTQPTDEPGKDQGKETKGGSETQGQETEGETKPQWLDNIPENTRFEQTEIRFLPVTTTHGKSVYVNVEDATGDIVEDAIIDRDAALEERLGVIINLLPEAGYEQLTDKVTNSVGSGADDYDVIIGYCSADIGIAQKGYLINLNNLNYLNFSANYWGKEYIKAYIVILFI